MGVEFRAVMVCDDPDCDEELHSEYCSNEQEIKQHARSNDWSLGRDKAWRCPYCADTHKAELKCKRSQKGI